MNKLFTKIVGLSLGLTMAVGVGVAVASGSKRASQVFAAIPSTSEEAYEVTFEKGANDSGTGAPTIGSGGDYATVGTTNKAYKRTKGLHLGSSSAVGSQIINFTTGAGGGQIKATYISVYAIQVDSGKSLKTTVTYTDSTTTTNTTATGSSLAYIDIALTSTKTISSVTFESVTKSKGRVAVDSFKIYKEKTASDYVGSLSVSPSTWTGYDSETLSVSSFTVSGSKNGTAGAVTSSDYEFKGIGYMSGDNFVARDASFSSGNPTTADTRLAWKAKYPTTSGGSTYAWAYVTLTVSADSVNSIVISGSMTKTTYAQGDAWDPAGFTVKAYYASAPSNPVDVTNNAGLSWSYSPATTASMSTTSVTCTASFGGKTATSSAQSVTITEKSYIGGIVNGGKYVIVAGSDGHHILPSAAEITSEPKNVASYTSSMKNDEAYCWTFTTTGVDNHWTITNSLGTSLKHAATNDGVRTSTTSATSDDFVASLTGDNITVDGTSYTGIYLVANSRYLTQYTANVSWRCYANANTNGTSKLALIPYETPDVLDSDLTLTGKPASLTAGSLFPGVTKAEAEYSETGTVDVTEDVTYTLGGTAISVGDTVPVAKVGASVTVVVTYTDANDDSATASFSIPVNYKPVTSVTLDKATATIGKSGTVDLTATVSDEYANQTVTWTTSSSSIATLSAATSTSGSPITVTGSASNAGNATITAYVDENDNGSLDSGEKSATCTVTVSGDPVLNIYDESSELVTGETLNKFTGDSNFYLNAVAQNFVGEITYTWSSSNTSAVSISEEADEMCEFAIVGSGNTTISCHAVGATSGNLTVSTTIHVVAPAVTSLTWDASNISAYTNQSLTSAIVNGWTVSYEKDNGDSGTVSFGTYDLYVGSEKVTSLPRAWSTADDGKTLHVEYGGVSTSTISVQVTEHLNAINYQVWSKVTDLSDLEAGDEIVIGEDTKGKFMTGDSGSMSSGNLATVNGTVTDGVVADMPSDAVRLTLGGSSDAWTLQNSAGEYLSITTTNSRHLQFVESSVTLGISIGDSGNATISSSSGTTVRILLNNSANPARFSTYNSSVSDSMLLPEIYKNSSSNIADTNATAQRALLGYAATFNSSMNCDDGGATEGVESKWSTLATTFTNTMNGLENDDKTVFKRLVANASAVEGGDSLQDFLARYDYIIAKYKISNDFLHSGADRGAVQYAHVNPLVTIAGEGNTAAIVAIVSVISLSAIGGYFFLRRRKEI